MKALKIILIIIVVVIGGYFIWNATLPADYHVERSTVVDASPEVVYDYVSDFKTWPEWGVWFEQDSTMKTTFGDKTKGVGASYSWTNDQQQNGSMSIVDAVENKSMKTELSFEGMGTSNGSWTFEPTEDGKTKVTWGFSGEFPLYMRWMGASMEKYIGPDFESGLANMKENVESMPKASNDISIAQVESMPYYGVTDEISWDEMGSDFFGERYGMIGNYLGEDMANMTMAPFAIYHMWDEDNKRAKVEVSIAATSDKPGTDRIVKGNTYGGMVIKGVYMGPYEGTGDMHWAIDEYVKANNYEVVGGPWEVYVTDPGEEPDTAKWITEIYYPVAPAGMADSE